MLLVGSWVFLSLKVLKKNQGAIFAKRRKYMRKKGPPGSRPREALFLQRKEGTREGGVLRPCLTEEKEEKGTSL